MHRYINDSDIIVHTHTHTSHVPLRARQLIFSLSSQLYLLASFIYGTRWRNEINCATLVTFAARNISARHRTETNQRLANEEKARALVTLSTRADI